MDADGDEPPAVLGRPGRRSAGSGWPCPRPTGGEGYGFAELAVVLEELGRAVAPGPMLPTVWAAAVAAAAAGADASARRRGADLAAGRRIGAVALGGALVGRRRAPATGVDA